MASTNSETVLIHRKNEERPIAKVILNGYNIKAGGSLGTSGVMRSFKLEQGDLWEAWSKRAVLTMRDGIGNEANIRIAAYPAEEGGTGFVEFI